MSQDAFDILKDMVVPDDPDKAMKIYREKLELAFGITPAQAFKKLGFLKFNPAEKKIDAFAAEVRRLVKKSHSKYPPEVQDGVSAQYFWNSLPETAEIRQAQALWNSQPEAEQTFDNAVKCCRTIPFESIVVDESLMFGDDQKKSHHHHKSNHSERD